MHTPSPTISPPSPPHLLPPAEGRFSWLIFAAINAGLYLRRPGLVWRYRWNLGRFPNIAHPCRYTERMLWRKLIDHNPQFVLFSDKLATKDYLRAHCPDLPIPQTLWVGDDFDAIPADLLRGDVLVKANHGCGFNHQIRAGQYDRRALRKKTRRWLRSGYGRKGGEWAYSRVEPRLFVEQSIGNADADLIEINVRASNGQPIQGSIIGKCKTPDQWAIYLDLEGNPTLGMRDVEGTPIPSLPEGLPIRQPYLRAVEFARRLSVGVDYARFDFMWNGATLYGGEITIYPAAGSVDPANAWINRITLTGWNMPHAHFLTARHTGWRRVYADALRRCLSAEAAAASDA